MVETITPVVHGGRRGRWGWLLAMHAAGATLAASTFGALLGGAGALLGAPWGAAGPWLVAGAALAYAAAEAFALPVPVPQLRRQVPDWWRTYFPFGPASFLYGVGLGVGFFTYLSHGTLVVVAGAAVAAGRPLTGATLLGVFGLARGLTAAAAVGTRTPDEGSALVDRLAGSAGWAGWRVVHGVALGAVVATAGIASTQIDEPAEWGAVAAGVLSLAFGAAAAAKLLRPSAWRRSLRSYRLPPAVEGIAFGAVPVSELAVAALPLAGLPSTAGWATLVLLGCFSAAIMAGRLRLGVRLDCGCFGAARARDYRLLLGRNALLAVVAVVAWRSASDIPLGRSLGVPVGGELLPAALVVGGLCLAAWLAVETAVAVRRGSGR